MPAAWCQSNRTEIGHCSTDLLRHSYTLPARWPFPGRVKLVMETEEGSCNLYRDSSVCCDITGHRVDDFVERHTTEALAAFLSGCARPGRTCHAADFGANNGWMTSYMLSLGAHVVSIEPQPDLAAAVNETALLNCWSDRSTVHNAFACAPPPAMRFGHCMSAKAVRGGWRMGGATPREGAQTLVSGMPVDVILTANCGTRGAAREV